MNNPPRRSARLSQQYTQQHTQFNGNGSASFPTFSASSSTTTTSHPSPVDESLIISGQQREQIRLQIQSQFPSAQTRFAAPLPSPSAHDTESYLHRSQTQNFFTMSQQGQQNNMQQSSQQQQQQQQQQYQNQGQLQQATQHHNSFSQSQRPANVHNNSHNANPGQLPPDFLAEAARRAQMACLMRDLGDVTL